MLQEIDKTIITKLRSAQQIVILSGAGTSAESGVPTFRDAQTGLWEKYKPEDLATPEAFANDPQMIWKWYQWRRQLIAKVNPNAGHRAITKLQENLKAVSVITQNVDGLHQIAGSTDVIEFHGNIRHNKCLACDVSESNSDNDTLIIPICPQCKNYLRPGVVWFGEGIPEQASRQSIKLSEKAEVFFSIGTSSQVYPAAGLVEIARQNDAMIIEVNPNSTPLSSSADYVFAEASGSFLPRLVDALTS